MLRKLLDKLAGFFRKRLAPISSASCDFPLRDAVPNERPHFGGKHSRVGPVRPAGAKLGRKAYEGKL